MIHKSDKEKGRKEMVTVAAKGVVILKGGADCGQKRDP